jgi:hypothetical protein
MRLAFAPNTGPLSDKSALPAEQEALASLFAGAIGSYKIPTATAPSRSMPFRPLR